MKALILASGLLLCPPVEQPPVWFKHNPNREVKVRFVQPDRIHEACVAIGVQPRPGYTILACAKGDTVWMPNPCRFADNYAGLMCHEMAHVNSWVHE